MRSTRVEYLGTILDTSAFGLIIFTGLYQGTRCVAMHVRGGKDDTLNSSIAGLFAGGIVAHHYSAPKSTTQFATIAVGVSALVSLSDLLRRSLSSAK